MKVTLGTRVEAGTERGGENLFVTVKAEFECNDEQQFTNTARSELEKGVDEQLQALRTECETEFDGCELNEVRRALPSPDCEEHTLLVHGDTLVSGPTSCYAFKVGLPVKEAKLQAQEVLLQGLNAEAFVKQPGSNVWAYQGEFFVDGNAE